MVCIVCRASKSRVGSDGGQGRPRDSSMCAHACPAGIGENEFDKPHVKLLQRESDWVRGMLGMEVQCTSNCSHANLTLIKTLT